MRKLGFIGFLLLVSVLSFGCYTRTQVRQYSERLIDPSEKTILFL